MWYLYTLLQKKRNFNLSIFPGAPGSLTLAWDRENFVFEMQLLAVCYQGHCRNDVWPEVHWHTIFPKRNAIFKNLRFFWKRVYDLPVQIRHGSEARSHEAEALTNSWSRSWSFDLLRLWSRSQSFHFLRLWSRSLNKSKLYVALQQSLQCWSSHYERKALHADLRSWSRSFDLLKPWSRSRSFEFLKPRSWSWSQSFDPQSFGFVKPKLKLLRTHVWCKCMSCVTLYQDYDETKNKPWKKGCSLMRNLSKHPWLQDTLNGVDRWTLPNLLYPYYAVDNDMSENCTLSNVHWTCTSYNN